MGRFLGKPEMESFPNAAKKGIKIFSDQQIQAVSGYERLYRLFWNRKAEELCPSPSFVKWSKSAITGVIVTEWSLKKPPCCVITPPILWIRSQKETISENKKSIQFIRAL